MNDPEKAKEYKYISLTLKKEVPVDTKDAVDALANLGEAAQTIEGWEVDSLAVQNYG